MMTSYFGNKAITKDPRAVSIARWTPRWWGPGRRYIALAPSADLLKRAKSGLPWSVYTEEYYETVLSKLDPAKVYTDLSDAVLCCWERPGENCHRRIIAEWIEKSVGVSVPEL